MRGKHNVNFDLAHATVQQATDECLLSPREFKSMVNWIPDNGVLVPRECFIRADDISPSYGTWNQGVFAVQRSSKSCWVLTVQADSNGRGWPVALLMDFSQSVNVPQQVIPAVPNAVTNQQLSTRLGQNWSFCEYRGNVFVSDGYQTWAWDGQAWHGPNNSHYTPNEHLAVGREFAFANAVEFEGRLVLGGTPCYGNELTWTDVWADVNVNTEWTGNPELGELAGTGVSGALRAIDFVTGLGYAGGQDKVLITTTSAGKKWQNATDLPKEDTDGRHVFGVAIDTDRATWVVTANDDSFAPKIWQLDLGAGQWNDITGTHFDYWTKFNRMRRRGETGTILFTGAQRLTVDTTVVYVYTINNGDTWYGSNLPTWNEEGTDMLVYGTEETATKLLCTKSTKDDTRCSVYRSEAGGAWDWVLRAERDYNFNALAYQDTGSFVIVVGNKGYVAYSDSTGAWDTWTQVTDSKTSDNLHDALIINGIGIVCGDNGTIIRDAAVSVTPETWVDVETGVFANLYALAYDGVYVYACGDGGVVIRSSDDGESWEQFTESENRFIDGIFVGVNEDIRYQHRGKGMLYVFTDKAAYSYNNQFGQNVVTPGFVIAAPRCCLEYFGALWVLGFYLGKAGLWRWDGVNAPILASGPVDDTINAANLQPVPQRMWFVADSETDFTPADGGIAYSDSTKVTYKYGILKLKQGKTVTIYSHGNGIDHGIGAATDLTGYYLPDKTAAVKGDFGHLALEIAFNDGDSKSTLDVQARYGHGTPGSITWTSAYSDVDWTPLHYVSGNKSYTKQGAVFGRLTYRLVEPSDAYNYRFVQFKINGTRGDSINTNWAINRIAICATVRDSRNSGVTPPFMYAYENRLYAMLGNSTGVVVSNNGESLATITENCPVSAVTMCDRIIQGLSPNDGLVEIRFSHSGSDANGFSQSIQTGRLGLIDSPRSILLRKKPRTSILCAVPTNGAADCILNLGRWTNGNSTEAITKTGLTFSPVHQPENSLLQVRVVTIPSAPTSGASYGNDFTLLLSNTTTFNPCRLKIWSVDFDTEDEEGRPTD